MCSPSLSVFGEFIGNFVILDGPITDLISHKTMNECTGWVVVVAICYSRALFTYSQFISHLARDALPEMSKVNLLLA